MKVRNLVFTKNFCQILRLKTYAIFLVCTSILLQSGFASNQVLIVGGAGGDKSFYDRFWKATSRFHNILVSRYGYDSDQITFLFEDNGEDPTVVDGRSTKLNIENTLSRISHNIDTSDRFILFWVGHANKSETGLKLNLPGRDLSLLAV